MGLILQNVLWGWVSCRGELFSNSQTILPLRVVSMLKVTHTLGYIVLKAPPKPEHVEKSMKKVIQKRE